MLLMLILALALGGVGLALAARAAVMRPNSSGGAGRAHRRVWLRGRGRGARRPSGHRAARSSRPGSGALFSLGYGGAAPGRDQEADPCRRRLEHHAGNGAGVQGARRRRVGGLVLWTGLVAAGPPFVRCLAGWLCGRHGLDRARLPSQGAGAAGAPSAWSSNSPSCWTSSSSR